MQIRPTTRKPFTVIAMRHSGTHLITPIVRFLTGKTVYSPKGEDALTCIPSPVVIVWLRDPRNWLVSSYKWKHGRTNVEPNDAELARFMARRRKQRSPVEFARAWSERWCQAEWKEDGRRIFVRFEDLRPEERGIAEVRRIRDFLGEGRDPETVYREVYGMSGTYTGQSSDWRQWFGKRTATAWAAHGGAEILQRMGYA